MNKIKKPIFVVGCGRSGTTIFFRTLAKHNELAYFSIYDNSFPRMLDFGFTQLLLKANTKRRALFDKVKPLKSAQETEGVWRYCNISSKGIPLTEKDYNEEQSEKLKRMIFKCMKYHNASRFVSKNTNNGMRIEYLNKVFPDSIFVHVIRDGRANVNSYLKVSFFSEIGFWWWDNKTLQDWKSEGKEPIELAALHWKHNVSEVLKQSKVLPKDRYFEIKYEEFNSDPKLYFKKVIEFCDLDWNKDFLNIIKNTKFQNRNFKWQENFNKTQKETIEKITGDLLHKFGYL